MGGEMLMPTENTETVDTTETETVETTETEVTPETNEETVETTTSEETVETKEEEVTTEELEEEETVETKEEPEDEDKPDTDKSVKELESIKGKLKSEQKKTETLKGQVKDLEAVVKSMVDSKLESIPKEYHELMPEGNIVKQLNWIAKAEKSGLFKKADESKDVEIGKPLNLGNRNEKANSATTGQQKLSNYFSGVFNKN